MDALQTKERSLEKELGEAVNYAERRRIRTELREVRESLKIESVDLNANTISYKTATESVTTTQVTESAVRLNDVSGELRQKTADERLARRERRKERQARFAKETEDEGSAKESKMREQVNMINTDTNNNNNNPVNIKKGDYDVTRTIESKIEQVNDDNNKRTLSNQFSLRTSTKVFQTPTNICNADNKAKERLGRVLSVGMMRDRFNAKQPANHKPVEFGTSYNKPKPSTATQFTPSTGIGSTALTYESKVNKSRFDRNQNQSSSYDAKPDFRQIDKQNSQHKTNNIVESSIRPERPSSFNSNSVNKSITQSPISKQEPEWKRTSFNNNNNKQSEIKPTINITNNNNNNVSLKRTPSQLISAAVERKRLEAKHSSDATKTITVGKATDAIKVEATQTKTCGLRETSSSYKKENPVPRPHHPTAPAGTGLVRGSASFSFGSNVSTRASERLKYFREAAEKEKARKEKLKDNKLKEEEEKTTAAPTPAPAPSRERLSSAPASVGEPAKDNRSAPCMKKREQKRPIRRTMSISSIVLDWCKEMVRDYGIQVRNFSSSWNDGMAFCALIHRFHPEAFNFDELSPVNREHNFRTAFETAYNLKKVPMLLDVEDMVNLPNPEPRSVQCYIQWIWSVYGPVSGYGPSQDDIKKAQVA